MAIKHSFQTRMDVVRKPTMEIIQLKIPEIQKAKSKGTKFAGIKFQKRGYFSQVASFLETSSAVD